MNAFFVPWCPEDEPENLQTITDSIKEAFRKNHDEPQIYPWLFHQTLQATVGDLLFVLRRTPEGLIKGVAMVGVILFPIIEPGHNDVGRASIRPVYMFDADRYDVLKPESLADVMPDVDWLHLDTLVQVPDNAIMKVVYLWMDYILAHYDTIIPTGADKKPRRPKAVTIFANPGEMSFSLSVYPFAYNRYHHKCDICGIDFDYVYEKLDFRPIVHFMATTRKSLSKGVPDYRSVSCICSNCWPLMARGETIDSLRAKARAVTCDNSTTIAMHVRLKPGTLLS